MESSLSPLEAKRYYYGLPSSPILVARSSTTPWVIPSGPWAYPVQKQLHPVFNHKLNDVWDGDLSRKVLACLDEMKVDWTSADIVRISEAEHGEPPTSTYVILWIGVVPKSLPTEHGKTVACRCRDILREFDVTDVEVEIRESSVIRSSGPKLLEPGEWYNPIADAQSPLTHALGLPIAAEATPDAEGTGGFFMAEGGDSEKLLLVTARHVVFPPNKGPNSDFKHEPGSQARFDVLLLGDKAYENFLASILAEVRKHGFNIDDWERSIEALKGKNGERERNRREDTQYDIRKGERAVEALYTLHKNVEMNWKTHASRVLGHVVCSPPISLGTGPEGYTEDYAIIEVDDDKIDKSTFQGNVMDLGNKIPFPDFMRKMRLDRWEDADTIFEYPLDRLLKVQGTITDEEMRHPALLDLNGEPRLPVIKSGNTTEVTIGHASGVMSFVRKSSYDDSNNNNQHHQISKEWAILRWDNKSGSFSEPGDSGAVIVDGHGRIGGLLTSGAGAEDSFDITYATPISFLLQSIKANGYPDARLIDIPG